MYCIIPFLAYLCFEIVENGDREHGVADAEGIAGVVHTGYYTAAERGIPQ